MWSCRLSKIKNRQIKQSIANSKAVAEAQVSHSFRQNRSEPAYSYFFSTAGRWQNLAELCVAGNLLAILLALAEAHSWQALSTARVLLFMLYINWVLLSFTAIIERLQPRLQQWGLTALLVFGFVLLQGIIFSTTFILNVFLFFGQNFTFRGLTLGTALQGVVLHLSYGGLLGAFCFRYLYIREQWIRQQHSELNARIQAMQARIHPHFLFNSLNSAISLIAVDPDKAEQMLLDLSRLFRASFQELKLVKLQDEIELCQRYLTIEQIRLGKRLHLEWKLLNPELFSQVQIPLLTLQPLLENSIFHGVEQNLSTSTVSVLVEITHNQVNIVITNPYIQDKINLRQGHGIAIDNVKQRLMAYYGRAVIFRTFAGDGMYTTVVQYPYK